MALTKLDAPLDAITSLSDTPSRTEHLTADDMKQKFTDNSMVIKDFINNVLLVELGGAGGAPNLGVFPNDTKLPGCDNIQEALEFLYDQILDATISGVPDNGITTAKLDKTPGSQAVTADTVRNGAVTESKLGTGSVVEGKIADGAVTAGKIGSGAVTEDKLGASAVTSGKIADGAVSGAKIANSAVTNNKIVSVEASKLTGLTAIENGGTGANTADNARVNLGLVTEELIFVPKDGSANITLKVQRIN